ncbi:unnamed protein product, partial [Musa acuminata var. zebrina]
IDPAKYQSISSGFGVVLKEQGARGFFRGWAPTLLWYSARAACKIGFSQFFKRYYSDIAGPEYATKYQMLIYLASFTSAEVIADAVKVRVQTAWICKGIALYKGIVPLWGQDNLMKFASFQIVFDMIYKYAFPRSKEKVNINLSRENIFGTAA